ncbi:MAG: gluconate 2-dehydrogenase subunit 3 family protein [Haloferacaceae archaeon]
MRLTRRDALAALAAAGVAGGGAVLLSERNGGTDAEGPLGDRAVETLVAAAEVLYPSPVEDVAAFVRRYARGRAGDRPDHAAGMAEAAEYLDEYAASWHDDRFAALDAATRDDTLRRMGADAADPDPSGSDVQRVRYYVVDELLFALYASPTGGKLVGLENPRGHPGGIESYQRGPEP